MKTKIERTCSSCLLFKKVNKKVGNCALHSRKLFNYKERDFMVRYFKVHKYDYCGYHQHQLIDKHLEVN